jgi:hypothetical protein
MLGVDSWRAAVVSFRLTIAARKASGPQFPKPAKSRAQRQAKWIA